jgi:hypothetical protein
MTPRNLYSPPGATTTDLREATVRPARPISAWLLEAVLVIMSLATLAGTWRMLWVIALDWHDHASPLGAAVSLAWGAGFLVSVALIIRGIHRGRPWARWLGLALIVGLAVFSVVRPDHSVYPNDAQRAGAQFARYLLFPMLCAWWAWAFALSRKARRYFAWPSAGESDAVLAA